MNLEQTIILKLINEQPRFKEMLKDIVLYRDNLLKIQDSRFSNDINDKFKESAFKLLTDDLTKELACSTEDVLKVLENLNLNEYVRI